MFHLPIKVGKRTSSLYKRRREMLIEILNEHFKKVVGSEVKQDVVLDVLKLTDSEKAQATNAIKAAFPGSNIEKKTLSRRLCHILYRCSLQNLLFALLLR